MDEVNGSNGRLEIASAVRDELLASAAVGYPKEACGILLGRVEDNARVVESFRPTLNRWPERDDRYEVDSESLRGTLAAEEAGGPRVLGFYHSHPDARPVPSATDHEMAWPWYYYLIVRVSAGEPAEARVWELDTDAGRFIERPIAFT